jgi:riboflavin kinase/FMN adenylyltransferase
MTTASRDGRIPGSSRPAAPGAAARPDVAGTDLAGFRDVQVWDSVAAARRDREQTGAAHVVTVGVFDGVHRGHHAVIGAAADEARRRGVGLAVVTFDPHPMAVVRPGHQPPMILPVERRTELLGWAGADAVLVLPFTAERAAQEPADFVREVLVDALGAVAVVVGRDFRFGRRAAGDVATLRELGEQQGFAVVALDDVGHDGIRWSSSEVRRLVAAGEVRAAAEVLGHPVILSGVVVAGERRGRDLGYPTANVDLSTGQDGLVSPPDGVYAGRLRRLDEPGAPSLPAAISIGDNPTFGAHGRRLEAFVLDRDDLQLYGVPVAVELVDRLRGMRQFPDADALLAAMHHDVARTREVLAR